MYGRISKAKCQGQGNYNYDKSESELYNSDSVKIRLLIKEL